MGVKTPAVEYSGRPGEQKKKRGKPRYFRSKSFPEGGP